MDVETSLDCLGGFGLLQTLNFLVYIVCSTISSWHLTGVVFTISISAGYRCSLPLNGTNLTEGLSVVSEQCSLVYEGGADDGDNQTTSCLHGWDYDTRPGETSVVTDLDLVCDHAILAGTLTSVLFGGALAGSYLSGQIADIIGRRLTVFGSMIGLLVTGTGLTFTWNFTGMVILRFLNGFFLPGSLGVPYVRLIEMFTTPRRLKGHLILGIMWVASISLLAPLAYLFPNWRHFQLMISLPCIPSIILVWFSYESIRWLVQKGRMEEAEKILQRIAKSKSISHSGYFLVPQQDPDPKNGSKPVKEDAFKLETMSEKEKGNPDGSQLAKETTNALTSEKDSRQLPGSKKIKKATVLDLFKTPVLFFRTLIVFYCWFTSEVVYFGFFINATNLVGSKYLNFFLIAATEAPCYITNYFVMRRFGRRRPLILLYFISGVTCVITGAIPTKTANGADLTVVILVSAIIGKFFASAAFDIVILMSAEVFPTVLRNAAFGAASMVGKAGSMMAPFIIYLNVIHSSIPMVVLGVISLAAGVCVMFLPETSNRDLPETFDDGTKLARQLGRDQENNTTPTHV